MKNERLLAEIADDIYGGVTIERGWYHGKPAWTAYWYFHGQHCRRARTLEKLFQTIVDVSKQAKKDAEKNDP